MVASVLALWLTVADCVRERVEELESVAQAEGLGLALEAEVLLRVPLLLMHSVGEGEGLVLREPLPELLAPPEALAQCVADKEEVGVGMEARGEGERVRLVDMVGETEALGQAEPDGEMLELEVEVTADTSDTRRSTALRNTKRSHPELAMRLGRAAPCYADALLNTSAVNGRKCNVCVTLLSP